MPLYTVVTQDGLLSARQRESIATELVRKHAAAMGVPADFVHSIFPTYPRNHGYVAPNHSAVASILESFARVIPPEKRHGYWPSSGTNEVRCCPRQSDRRGTI
jgi:hypothetical protein